MGDGVREGTLAMPLAEGVSLAMVDVDGLTCATTLVDPETWIGRELDVTGDDPTLESVAAARRWSEVDRRSHRKPADGDLSDEMTFEYRF